MEKEQAKPVLIYGADRSKLMEIQKFERSGDTLVFKGKIMGAMPITAVVTPDQVRQILKSMGIGLLFFAASMLFRKEPKDFAGKK